MRGRLVKELDLIQQEIFKLAGGDFNLNSTPQLREVLFERLELPVLKRTKTCALVRQAGVGCVPYLWVAKPTIKPTIDPGIMISQ
jgi:hypothetical protein